MERIIIKEGDITHLVSAAYALSEPVGMGFLHFRPGELDDATLEGILAEADKRIQKAREREASQPDYYKDYSAPIVAMDYVHGRCCKFNIWYRGNELFISNDWYDHAGWQFDELLSRCGIKREVTCDVR